MKKTLYIIGLTFVVFLSSCSDNWLNQQPGGSSITQEQYQNMEMLRIKQKKYIKVKKIFKKNRIKNKFNDLSYIKSFLNIKNVIIYT